MGVFGDWGAPIQTPTYYDPNYMGPHKASLIFINSHMIQLLLTHG